MIRPFTCVCALMAGASGLYLYSEKHQTTLLDQQISKIVADTQQTRERTAMLRAEWALLNQPDRLQGLATRFLPQLQAMAPTQFVQLAALDKRLPAPGPETPPHPIATPATAPGLIGAPPAAAAPNAAASPAPDHAVGTDGVAIAQIDQHLVAAHRTARIPVAHDAGPRRETQLADAGGASDADDAAAQTVVPQAAPRRVAAHAPVHDPAARRLASHPTAPTRLAAYVYTPPTRPLMTTVSSYGHAQLIAAASWRPAHAAWAAPRPAAYPGPAAGSGLGSSLGAGRAALPAPVPLSDGN